jgi:hypothetical protein
VPSSVTPRQNRERRDDRRLRVEPAASVNAPSRVASRTPTPNNGMTVSARAGIPTMSSSGSTSGPIPLNRSASVKIVALLGITLMAQPLGGRG